MDNTQNIENYLNIWYFVLVMFFFNKINRRTHPPLYVSTVAAGFPSPADDYMEGTLDLNEFLIAHPAATPSVTKATQSPRKAWEALAKP